MELPAGERRSQGPAARVARLFTIQNLIIAGVLLIVAYFTLVPLVFLLVGTFRTPQTAQQAATWTLANYARAYGDLKTLAPLLTQSLTFAGGSALLALTVGTLLAWITERTDTPARGFIFILSLVPMIMPGILSSVAWIFLLSPKIGLLNQWAMGLLHLGSPPFNAYSIGGMVWVEGLHLSPAAYLLMVATFKSMDPSLEESAQMSGARLWQTFYHITLKMAWPSIFSVLLISFVRGLEAFEVPTLFGLPVGLRVFTSRIYEALHTWPPDYGLGGAYAIALLAITSAGVWFYSLLTRQAHRFATVTGKGYKPAPMKLGPWKYATLAVVFIYFVFMLGLPLFVLLWSSFQPYYRVPSVEALQTLTLKNYVYVFHYPKAIKSFLNSLYLSAGAATLVVLLTAVVSWITVKSKIRGRWLFDNMAFLPMVFPGLILGVSIMFVYLTLPIPIYGTIWILLVAYITRYMPYGMRYTSTSMVQLSSELEESAQVNGASWWRTFRSITLPLLKPGAVAGWTYIFVVSFRELSSSILLYSPGSEVASITIWELWENGQYNALTALGVMLCLVLLVVALAMQLISRKVGVKE